MSAASAGSLTERMPDSMRTMLFDGNRSFISSQRSCTSFHARAPLSRLAMQAAMRKGAFCVRTVGCHRQLEHPGHLLRVADVGERVEEPQLLLRRGAVAEALDDDVDLVRPRQWRRWP